MEEKEKTEIKITNEIEKEKNENSYELLKNIGKTKKGELFLISYDLNKSGTKKNYLLNKINIKSKEEEKQISDEVEKIKSLNSKFIIKIYDSFIENQKEKEYYCIIMENFEKGNLLNLIEQKNHLNSRLVWRIFIKLVLGIKEFHEKDMILQNLCPQNIFIDNEGNVQLGGYGITLDFIIKESLISYESYYSPEVLKGQNVNKKCDIWSLGCILYELLFKEKPFKSSDDLFKYNYKITNKCDSDAKYILSKLLSQEIKRISIKELLTDMTFKKKLLEVNLFDELVEPTMKGK